MALSTVAAQKAGFLTAPNIMADLRRKIQPREQPRELQASVGRVWPNARPGAMNRQCQIMLVEDDPFDERLALRVTSKCAGVASVRVARDGAEAIEMLANEASEPPDLVLLDLKLPKKHGHEVLQWIRSNDRTRLVPVVCFSSSAERRDVVGCYDLGANSFVRKAVDYDEYTRRLSLLLEFWTQVSEPCRPEEA